MKLYNDSFIFCNESLYCLLSSCTNHIFGENVVPKIQTKMLVANQIADFLSQLDLQNKMMKRPDFLACRYKSIEIKS